MPAQRTQSRTAPYKVAVVGWFFSGKPDSFLDSSNRITVGPCYIKTARRFDPRALVVLEERKIVGPFWNPIYVRAVSDTEGELYPFFVEEKHVPSLKSAITKSRKRFPN